MQRFTFIYLCLLLIACGSRVEIPVIDDAYIAAFGEYEKARQEERDYYLKLCGLSKLPELTSSFGSGATADIVVSVEGVPAQVGYFVRQADGVTFIAADSAMVTNAEGVLVDTIDYQFDESGNSDKLFLGNLSWMIITRAEAPYVRSWDEANSAVHSFKSFDRFELTRDFIFPADFRYYDQAKLRMVSTQLGPPEKVTMVGELTFEYQGKSYTLEVGSNGFTMVGDATTGQETYGGGRYIDLVLPPESGPLLVDFNKLYNPPCTFSSYTTCQYPSEANILPFKLLAGERYTNH